MRVQTEDERLTDRIEAANIVLTVGYCQEVGDESSNGRRETDRPFVLVRHATDRWVP